MRPSLFKVHKLRKFVHNLQPILTTHQRPEETHIPKGMSTRLIIRASFKINRKSHFVFKFSKVTPCPVWLITTDERMDSIIAQLKMTRRAQTNAGRWYQSWLLETLVGRYFKDCNGPGNSKRKFKENKTHSVAQD